MGPDRNSSPQHILHICICRQLAVIEVKAVCRCTAVPCALCRALRAAAPCTLHSGVQVGPPHQGQPREQLSFQQPGPSQFLSSAIQNTSGISPQPFSPQGQAAFLPTQPETSTSEQPTVCLLPEVALCCSPFCSPCSLVSTFCTLLVT